MHNIHILHCAFASKNKCMQAHSKLIAHFARSHRILCYSYVRWFARNYKNKTKKLEVDKTHCSCITLCMRKNTPIETLDKFHLDRKKTDEKYG